MFGRDVGSLWGPPISHMSPGAAGERRVAARLLGVRTQQVTLPEGVRDRLPWPSIAACSRTGRAGAAPPIRLVCSWATRSCGSRTPQRAMSKRFGPAPGEPARLGSERNYLRGGTSAS